MNVFLSAHVGRTSKTVIIPITHNKPDQDVTEEEQRIIKTPVNTLLKTDALLLCNLTKHFVGIPAVDGICVGIPLNGKDTS